MKSIILAVSLVGLASLASAQPYVAPAEGQGVRATEWGDVNDWTAYKAELTTCRHPTYALHKFDIVCNPADEPRERSTGDGKQGHDGKPSK